MLWFVVARDHAEQLQIPQKIDSILRSLTTTVFLSLLSLGYPSATATKTFGTSISVSTPNI
jgi:hypothetical protein